MSQARTTAGLLPRPVWLLVRAFDPDSLPKALGPIRTLEKLKGVAEGIAYWANDQQGAIRGFTDTVPAGYKKVELIEQQFEDLERQTFEQQLVNILWYDEDEKCWDEEKEWNADRWQDVGTLLESFGIEFPGVDAPHPA
jgi:hypothetical protein